MSIRMPGGSVCEGACIAAGVVVVGACEQRNKNRVCGRAECVMGEGVESVGGTSGGKMEGLIRKVVEV
jgi:hypothetical protein